MRRLWITLGTIAVASVAAAHSVSQDTRFDFGPPVNLSSIINSAAFDGGPSISSDGLTLYFASDRAGGLGGGDLWVATRAKLTESFGIPRNLGPEVNSPANEFAPSISADGLALYFDSDRPGGLGSFDIWMATRKTTAEHFDYGRNLGAPVNSDSSDGLPNISTDGLSLYYSSRRSGGVGEMDLWVARRDTDSGPFLRTENLGPTVNSAGYDGEPSISADGFHLFFSSDRPGGHGQRDLWIAARSSHGVPFRVSRNLGRLVNSPTHDVRPSISADGSTLFFMSNRSGGFGHIDLWQTSNRAPPRHPE